MLGFVCFCLFFTCFCLLFACFCLMFSGCLLVLWGKSGVLYLGGLELEEVVSGFVEPTLACVTLSSEQRHVNVGVGSCIFILTREHFHNVLLHCKPTNTYIFRINGITSILVLTGNLEVFLAQTLLSLVWFRLQVHLQGSSFCAKTWNVPTTKTKKNNR